MYLICLAPTCMHRSIKVNTARRLILGCYAFKVHNIAQEANERSNHPYPWWWTVSVYGEWRVRPTIYLFIYTLPFNVLWGLSTAASTTECRMALHPEAQVGEIRQIEGNWIQQESEIAASPHKITPANPQTSHALDLNISRLQVFLNYFFLCVLLVQHRFQCNFSSDDVMICDS